MARTRRTVTALMLFVVAGFAMVSASFVGDSSGAHLELAPVFFGLAIAVVSVRTIRSRSRRGRG